MYGRLYAHCHGALSAKSTQDKEIGQDGFVEWHLHSHLECLIHAPATTQEQESFVEVPNSTRLLL